MKYHELLEIQSAREMFSSEKSGMSAGQLYKFTFQARELGAIGAHQKFETTITLDNDTFKNIEDRARQILSGKYQDILFLEIEIVNN